MIYQTTFHDSNSEFYYEFSCIIWGLNSEGKPSHIHYIHKVFLQDGFSDIQQVQSYAWRTSYISYSDSVFL